MTVSIAITGKSGNGKTTFVKALANVLKSIHPQKTVLLVDTDVTNELSWAYGVNAENKISDLLIGSYKAKLPQDISAHELAAWAINDILIEIKPGLDLLVYGYNPKRECKCYLANAICSEVTKTTQDYDYVIFDCEYNVGLLNKLVDTPIDTTLIITDTTAVSLYLASKIKEKSIKYACPGQIGIILNKVKNFSEETRKILSDYELNILGHIPYDPILEENSVSKNSELIETRMKELLFRLNIPF
ncbi:MAG: AAA family ATPase [bacterium]